MEQIEETRETNDEIGDNEKEVDNESSDDVSDESADQLEEGKSLRSSARPKKLPKRFEEYEMAHLALSAESFVDSVPESLETAKERPDYENWKEAVDNEIKALEKNNTWTLIEKPKNVKLIDSRWVFRLKRHPDGQIKEYKARLVAKGFMQKKGFDYKETYAPVARLTTVRTLLVVINHRNLLAQQMDVKSAFLNGILEEDIYMRIPEGFESKDDRVCKLNKALYGLKQVPLCWNNKFNEFAQEQQLRRSEYDPCLYIGSKQQTVVYLLIYVDDIILASNDPGKIMELKAKLTEMFDMSDIGEVTQFLGINIRQTQEGMYLNQKNYLLNLLEKFGMSNCKACKTPMETTAIRNETKDDDDTSEAKNRPIRELVGCLMYVMLGTHPDLSIAVNYCSRFQDKPNDRLWKALKRILRYIKGTIDLELFYTKHEKTKLVGYADSDYAGDERDRISTTGYLYKVFGGTVCWTTRKQTSTALSSTEAEYVALTEAACEGIWLVNLFEDINVAKTKFVIYEDNQSCIKLTEKWDHKRLRHIDVKYNFIKELVRDKRVSVEYISTKEQTADILTKNLMGVQFSKLRQNLGLRKTEITNSQRLDSGEVLKSIRSCEID